MAVEVTVVSRVLWEAVGLERLNPAQTATMATAMASPAPVSAVGGNGNGNGHNGHGAGTLGERLAYLRKEADISQSLLAERAGLTQCMLSRLETAGRIQRVPVPVLRALAEGLEMDLAELVKGTPLDRHVKDEVDEDPGRHVVYCPNPICGLNRVHTNSEGWWLEWSSQEAMASSEWQQMDICGRCGTRLIKACPQCGKRIRRAPEFYCSRCGCLIDEGPTVMERKYISGKYGKMLLNIPQATTRHARELSHGRAGRQAAPGHGPARRQG